MKVIIDISEEVYKDINKDTVFYNDYEEELRDAIRNGTPISDNATWVDTNERLPEEAFGCLVTILDTDLRTQDEFENILPYFVGYDGETWNNADGEPIPFEVVAWMKLPAPYKATV